MNTYILTQVLTMTPLEVYAYFDLPLNYDINVLIKCFDVYINTQLQEFKLINLHVIDKKDLQNVYQGDDIVKHGLSVFVKMYEQLKLKTTNNVWFFMIGNGNIRNLYKDVTIMLLNRNPSLKQSNYIITRDILLLTKDMNKESKLASVRKFTKDMKELIETEKVIKYNNVT